MYCTTSENREYLVIIKKPKEGSGRQKKTLERSMTLMNDLSFNLYVVPWSPVVRLVTYFGVEGSRQNRGPKKVE